MSGPLPSQQHVDLLRVDPYGNRAPFLLTRLAPDGDDYRQARAGWATYEVVSEPHTMAECPFSETGSKGRRRVVRGSWMALEAENARLREVLARVKIELRGTTAQGADAEALITAALQQEDRPT